MLQRYVKTSNITIAVIPLGTGNDWIKTYKIATSIKKSIEYIYNKQTYLQDIGLLKTKNKITYFNNVAGLGYDGYIVHKLNRLKNFGAIAYLWSGIAGLFLYKKTLFKIIFNDKIIEEKCLMTIFGICKFSGGGMQFTKNVKMNDGFLDITIAKNLNILDIILNIKKLYSGDIVNHKKLETYKTKEIKVYPLERKTFIQADGELINTGEVHVTIIERAIQFVIPPT
jgi:diacylglycerol kinase family enzyme